MRPGTRKVFVLGSLALLLTLTSGLLVALAPPPITSEGYNTLSAAAGSEILDALFKTPVAPQPDRWKFIFIHQSGADAGDARTLAQPETGLCDHFVIGNGQDCPDGQIEIGPRWENQQPADAGPGVASIDPDCISICLIGNLDRQSPTAAQLHRLTQLVATLQSELRIGGDQVVLLTDAHSPSGIGDQFPVDTFRQNILP